MKKKLRFGGIFFLVSGLLLSAYFFMTHFSGQNLAVREKTIILGGQRVIVELAETAPARQSGLSGREHLCADCAMLFAFEAPGEYSFWMKDMRFDLDILWLAGDKIVYVAKNVSHSKGEAEIVAPKVEADKVLEINAGLADKWKISIGDNVQYE